MDLFHASLSPFTAALGFMAFLAFLEIIGLLMGGGLSEIIDSALPDFDGGLEFDLDGDSPSLDAGGQGIIAASLSWLCVGKVPILILLAAFCGTFGLSGIAVQNLSTMALGGFLPTLIAIPLALVAALFGTRTIGLGMARVMPKEETDAVSSASFVGRVATVIRGTAQAGTPAEAKLRDAKGTVQYILVEPDREKDIFTQNDDVLIVEKKGATYLVIANESTALASNPEKARGSADEAA